MKVQSQVLVQEESNPHHGRAGTVTREVNEAGTVEVKLDATQDGKPEWLTEFAPAELRTLLAG